MFIALTLTCVLIVFVFSYFLSLFCQQDADITGTSEKVINDMIVYVDEVCKCGFNVRSLSPVQAKCHNDTLLVSTDMTLPDNQQYSKFITYLENWLETDPHFTRNNGGITVYVNDLDAAPLAHSATSGSGEEESSGTTPTTGMKILLSL